MKVPLPMPDAAYASLTAPRLHVLLGSMMSVKDVPGASIEIGVFEGGTLGLIAFFMECQAVDGKIYGADTFCGFYRKDVSAFEDRKKARQTEDGDWYGVGVPGHTANEVREWLSRCGLEVELLEGRIQDTAYRLADEKFRFVHLDVDLYLPTKFSLDFFYPRLSPGGVILVDDAGKPTCPGIQMAIDDFLVTEVAASAELRVADTRQAMLRKSHE